MMMILYISGVRDSLCDDLSGYSIFAFIRLFESAFWQGCKTTCVGVESPLCICALTPFSIWPKGDPHPPSTLDRHPL